MIKLHDTICKHTQMNICKLVKCELAWWLVLMAMSSLWYCTIIEEDVTRPAGKAG